MKEPEKENLPAEKKNKKKMILILCGAGLGILLLLAGSGWFTRQTGEEPAAVSSCEELEQYRTGLEERIVSLCEAVAGVSDVRVAVTLSGGFEMVYATEVKNGIEVYATIGSGSNAKALVVAQNPPDVVGIGVVCRGGNDSTVRGTLTALLASAFHVPTNRISIAGADP